MACCVQDVSHIYLNVSYGISRQLRGPWWIFNKWIWHSQSMNKQRSLLFQSSGLSVRAKWYSSEGSAKLMCWKEKLLWAQMSSFCFLAVSRPIARNEMEQSICAGLSGENADETWASRGVSYSEPAWEKWLGILEGLDKRERACRSVCVCVISHDQAVEMKSCPPQWHDGPNWNLEYDSDLW